ncbi:MAG: polyprenyl synthetase family protein [Deltaproteobacteria bacterium]|nr:polyprenyl synthetase family protein [Deltaproteobacteria bacterium]
MHGAVRADLARSRIAGPGAGDPRRETVVLERLEALASGRGHDDLAERLGRIARWLCGDLGQVEAVLAATADGTGHVRDVVHHLLDLGGKRLRPMCVALAARAGSGFGPAALELAVAVELVHTATLMHDDVVDLGDTRRGAPAARHVFGNAASIFAGDWLLVEALRRIRFAGLPGLLERMLEVVEEMIVAETRQLEGRGRFNASLDDYLSIVRGKTAALFRWAMAAGGRAGWLGKTECAALEEFGSHVGIAFQVVDDVLDLAGDPSVTGKALFADLREGKMTHPMIVAASRAPELTSLLGRAIAGDPSAAAQALDRVACTHAVEESMAFARREAQAAVECLQVLPAGLARQSLECVADAAIVRRA